MKLEVKDLKSIINTIKNNEDYQNLTPLIKNVLDNCYYSEELFYTIEFTDIIANENKKDNSFKKNSVSDIYKMLLYILRNKNVKFDKRFFDITLELTKLDASLDFNKKTNKFEINEKEYKRKIYAVDYNKLLFFLAIDYSNPFISECEDDLFTLAINDNYDAVVFNILDIYANVKNSKELFRELSKYSPIIGGIVLNNSDYIKDLSKRKIDNFVENSKRGYFQDYVMYDLECRLFSVLIGIFISKVKELNYNYSIITPAIQKVMEFVNSNISYVLNENYAINIEELQYLKEIMLQTLYQMSDNKCKILN